MKTIKGLKKAILDNNGTLKIGPLRIEHDGSGDIDIRLNNNLIGWISATGSDTERLEEVRGTVASDVLRTDIDKNMADRAEVAEEKATLAEARIDELETQSVSRQETVRQLTNERDALRDTIEPLKLSLKIYESILNREMTLKASNEQS